MHPRVLSICINLKQAETFTDFSLETANKIENKIVNKHKKTQFKGLLNWKMKRESLVIY